MLGSDLAPHLDRDAVLYVDSSLDLTLCAMAIARDNAHAVNAWLTLGTLRRPTPDERALWRSTPDRSWRAVVVQPFVLIQALN